jgi:hypothetical protein
MRNLASLFVFAILSTGAMGSANAQDTPAPQPPFASEQAQHEPVADDSIFDEAGAEIGSIENVMAKADGSADIAVSVGEFLGLGGKTVLLSSSDLTPRDEGGYSVSYTEEQLEAMPEYSPEP